MWSPAPTDTSIIQLLHLKLRDHRGRGDKKDYISQKNRKFIVRLLSPKNVREAIYTHEVALAWMPKQDPNKDETTLNATMEGGNLMGTLLHAKNYRQ